MIYTSKILILILIPHDSQVEQLDSMVARRENLANNSAGIIFGYVIYMT